MRNYWLKAAFVWLAAILSFSFAAALSAEDSLPPLVDGKVPQNLDELWGNYDSRKDPLETTVVREWKEGSVTCRYVVFTIGTFKGKVSRIAAFYAFPTDIREKLPAVLDLHGGGQKASLTVVIFQAQNGYAGLSINWGGNPMDGMKEGEPNTDWGALDATQKHNDHYGTMKPDAKTLDAVESPRNNNWFFLVLAARRGLTFLEQQPEVDAQRLGVTGHSMGGKLTTDVAGIDARLKAAVPSCGGCGSAPGKISGMPGSGMRNDESALHLKTIDDCAYIPRIRCPILYLSPTNDFAGPLDNMAENWKQIGSKDVHYAISPHFNHRHVAEFSVSQYLLLEQYLKNGAALPGTPVLEVKLDTADGVPVATLKPERVGEVTRADIYYSVDPHVLTRFWRDAQAKREGDAWVARCPVMSADQPLYVIASVYYPLKQTFKRYQWLGFDHIKEFAISSTMIAQLPTDLKKAGVKATDSVEAMIDDFSREWHDWTRLEWGNPHVWDAATRKIKDPKWRGPDGAQLAIDVKAPKDCTLVVRVRQNDWGAYPNKPGGEYAAALPVKVSPDWQTLTCSLQDFRPVNDGTKGPLVNWSYVTELSLRGSAEVLKDGEKTKLGGQAWNEPRQFRNFRWVGGQQPGTTVHSGNGALTQEQLDGQIQKAIKESTDQEKRERDGK
ncbi:MAG: acetylxylan esterase [Planctomycetota bacterium]|nr:acetylxylan esterase [Planctomycetota bacterium]